MCVLGVTEFLKNLKCVEMCVAAFCYKKKNLITYMKEVLEENKTTEWNEWARAIYEGGINTIKTHLFFKEFAAQVLVFWGAEFFQHLEAFPCAVASPAGLNSRHIQRSSSNVIFIQLEGRFTRPWVTDWE